MQKNDTLPLESSTFTPSPDSSVEIPLTITPSWKNYIARFGILRISLIIGIIAIAYFRFGAEGTLWLIACIAVLLAVVLWRLFSRKLTVTDTEIQYRNGWGVTRRLAFDEIGQVNYYTAYVEPTFGIVSRMLIGTKDDKHFLSLVGQFWEARDIERVATALQKKKVATKVYEQVFSWGQMAHYFPTLVPKTDRHPILIALWTFLIGLALVLGWYFITEVLM